MTASLLQDRTMSRAKTWIHFFELGVNASTAGYDFDLAAGRADLALERLEKACPEAFTGSATSTPTVPTSALPPRPSYVDIVLDIWIAKWSDLVVELMKADRIPSPGLGRGCSYPLPFLGQDQIGVDYRDCPALAKAIASARMADKQVGDHAPESYPKWHQISHLAATLRISAEVDAIYESPIKRVVRFARENLVDIEVKGSPICS
jgi:hypothetical protein